MSISPFVFLVAFLPLAAYLTLFGTLRLLGRPIVMTGARDIVAIAIAVSGLIVVGPVELFFPEATAALIGIRIWLVLAFLYGLIVLLIVISSRPRLVVYGMTANDLLPHLVKAAGRLDAAAQLDSSGGTISLPSLGIHLRVDSHRGTDISEVFAYETGVLPSFWRHLRTSLLIEVAQEPKTLPRRGSMVFTSGIIILFFVFYVALSAPDTVVQELQAWLWR